MNTVDRKTRWQNAFIYALVTTIMLLGSASILSFYLGESQRKLADRVDENAAVSVTAADAIICILQLGVSPNDPPRSAANVEQCLVRNGYVDIPTVQHGDNE